VAPMESSHSRRPSPTYSPGRGLRHPTSLKGSGDRCIPGVERRLGCSTVCSEGSGRAVGGDSCSCGRVRARRHTRKRGRRVVGQVTTAPSERATPYQAAFQG
jgi:hypothetical protein